MTDQLLDSVKSKYGAVAESSLSSDHAGVKAVAEAFGYSADELTSIPAEANMGLSCGNPTATAHLQARRGRSRSRLRRRSGCLSRLEDGGAKWPRHRHRHDTGHDRALASERPQGRLHQCRIPSIHHRPHSSPRCLRRLRHLELRHQSRAGQTRRLPRDRPRSKTRRPSRNQRHRPQHELPEAVAQSMAAYVGCIAGAILIDDYRAGLLAAGFQHVEIVDSGADLNAYAKVENQAGCCSPAMDGVDNPFQLVEQPAATSTREPSLHEELTTLLSQYDVNAAAASVKVYALKPAIPNPLPAADRLLLITNSV